MQCYDILNPEELHQAIEHSGRIPLQRPPFPHGFTGFWQLVRRIFFTHSTSPKHAFRISSWEYIREFSSPEHGTHGGFIFSFALHETENRWHLNHTLLTSKLSVLNKIPLVIASARDMANPDAWVRCIVVNTATLNLPKKKSGHVAIQSLASRVGEGPIVYRAQSPDGPHHAI